MIEIGFLILKLESDNDNEGMLSEGGELIVDNIGDVCVCI